MFQLWNGTYFERTTLLSIDPNLDIQLGHSFGTECPIPEPRVKMTVLDTNGIHTVFLRYCGCPSRATRTAQLLRHSLFPATIVNPGTVATVRLLKYFQLLNFTSKISVSSYYDMLVRLTDNTGLDPPQVSRFDYYLTVLC